MKKILVTGGAGFIGSNFIMNQLNSNEYEIINFDKLTYAGNLDNLRNIKKNERYLFIRGDIANKKQVMTVLEKNAPDYIVNFAAESHVDRSIDKPIDFLLANVLGTGVLLESIREYLNLFPEKGEQFRFLHISTDEVFGSLGSKDFFTEQTPYDPSSPYSASKASSDHLVRAWHRTYNIPVLITNCSNNYGPFQFPEKLIPLMIINCLEELPLPVYGNGKNIRDWLYVEDHCRAIDLVLRHGKIGDTYCIGANNEIKNIMIVKTICSIMDKIKPRKNKEKYSDLISYVEDRPGHDFRYSIDTSKISKDLNWEPKESFESGIKKTIEWYLNNKDWLKRIKDSKYKQERLGVI